MPDAALGFSCTPMYAVLEKLKQGRGTSIDSFWSMNGAFVGRRADGSHNAVSPDMLLEQTYNADAKEESGLDAIALNIAARTKWVYTKPVTAAVSAQLKSMLHLHGDNSHHECIKDAWPEM